jgi:prepilin-type N-terminal cleavage/methylation domain-containing protein
MKINVKRKLQEAVNGNAEGFSLIELIMVIAIAGITMAIALPKFTAVNEVDLYSAASQVKSDIRYTQELAMSKYAIRTIDFAGNSNTYNIKDSDDVILESKELPPRSKAIFSSGSTLIFTFNAAGEPITGGGGTLTISSGGSNEQIVVSSITGKAEIL